MRRRGRDVRKLRLLPQARRDAPGPALRQGGTRCPAAPAHGRAILVGVKPAIDHLWSLAPRGPNHGGYAARRRHVLASQGAAAAARARGAASASAKDAARSVNSQTWMKPRDGHQGVRWESRAAQQLRSTMAGAHRLRHPAHFEEPHHHPNFLSRPPAALRQVPARAWRAAFATPSRQPKLMARAHDTEVVPRRPTRSVATCLSGRSV